MQPGAVAIRYGVDAIQAGADAFPQPRPRCDRQAIADGRDSPPFV